MTNEQLAHELMIDPAFTLDEHGGSRDTHSVHTLIRSSLHVAFWNSLEDDIRLRPTPLYTRVMRVLGEIHDGVKDLASGGGAWKGAGAISSVIDIDHLHTQLKNGVFEWASCVRLINDVANILNSFPKEPVASPSRHVCGSTVAVPASVAATAAATTTATAAATATATAATPPTLKDFTWAELQDLLDSAAEDSAQRPHAFCTALRVLLDQVKAVRITVANARLRLIAPVIKDHGVEYARSHVDKNEKETEASDGVGVFFDRTRVWVRQCIGASCSSSSVQLQDLTINDNGKARAFNTVLREGIVSLVANTGAFNPASLAESLALDRYRLAKMHGEFQSQVTFASALVLLQEYLVRHREKSARSVLADVAHHMDRALPPNATLPTIVGAASAALVRYSLTDDTSRKHFCKMLLTTLLPTGKVHAIMSARLRALLLRAVSDTEDVFRDTGATKQVFLDLTIPSVLASLMPRFKSTGRLLRKVTAVHIAVYACRYNAILPVEAAALAEASVLA
jgi:hypothetical protein